MSKKHLIGFTLRHEEVKEATDESPENLCKAAPKHSVVSVYFPQKKRSLTYYNDHFDLKEGSLVFVDGKMAGFPDLWKRLILMLKSNCQIISESLPWRTPRSMARSIGQDLLLYLLIRMPFPKIKYEHGFSLLSMKMKSLFVAVTKNSFLWRMFGMSFIAALFQTELMNVIMKRTFCTFPFTIQRDMPLGWAVVPMKLNFAIRVEKSPVWCVLVIAAMIAVMNMLRCWNFVISSR